MSNWAAIEIGGEAVSAWEYRAEFLKYGTKHDNFYCPFCNVRLAAYLICTEGEISKSPHFSARWGDHTNGCDGEPIVVDAPDRKRPEAHYVPRDMHFPEAFSDRPPPRKQRPAGIGNSVSSPTSIEISERRRKAGSLGRPIPKTYLLQPIVEAYNAVWKDGYERAKEKKWEDEARLQWTKDCLAAMPLRLDDATNYGDAFRPPTYIKSVHSRIYHADGTVIFQDGDYVIGSKKNGKKQGVEFPFRVVVKVGHTPDTSPKSHIALLSILKDFVAGNQEVRWYAYGVPEANADAFVITIENLDYLYIKRAFMKKAQ